MNAAIKFWEKPKNIISIFNGMLKVFAGTISWRLFTNKYDIPVAMPIILIFLLAVLAILLYQQLRKYFKSQNTEVNQ